jgi:hypothetical protein
MVALRFIARAGWQALELFAMSLVAVVSKRPDPHIEAIGAKGMNVRRGEWDAYEFIAN